MNTKRFIELKTRIWKQLGERLELLHNGSVISDAHFHNRHRSLQAAIDHYARYLPSNFVNPS